MKFLDSGILLGLPNNTVQIHYLIVYGIGGSDFGVKVYLILNALSEACPICHNAIWRVGLMSSC